MEEFLAAGPTPATTCQFEKDLQKLLREMGRLSVTWVYNHVESPATETSPEQVGYHSEFYRRRTLTKNRHGLGSLFGHVPLWRIRYEPLEPGLPCIFPLELRLGITADRATPALGRVEKERTALSVFPLPPLKFRTVGFPQYGFKLTFTGDLR